ncbi:MAG: guanylate kinase [Actinobacteria bacterium]|nr:guanylate kinase [Actinomycetota bacterium]
MQPPKLSNRFRRKAGQKAVAARQERAKTKELIATGQIFFFELFSDERESISRMRLIDLLQGPRQIELLREEFLLMKNSPRSGKLLVVSGPSGVGKSTITNQLRGDDRFWISVSVTTRKMRAGEVDGVNYHFVNDDVFDRMISNGEFLEFAEFAGAKYGTPRKPVESALTSGKNVILEIELNGARQIRKNSKDAIMVFIEPPTWEELTARLINRGTESDLSAQARLERAKEELSAASEFDHVLVNHQVEQSVAELVSLALQ